MVEVKNGAIGTKGGPRTDTNAQVLDVDFRRIEGLYAVGNVMAAPMGMTYGGAAVRWDRQWCSAIARGAMQVRVHAGSNPEPPDQVASRRGAQSSGSVHCL